jgi:hypothetical protein
MIKYIICGLILIIMVSAAIYNWIKQKQTKQASTEDSLFEYIKEMDIREFAEWLVKRDIKNLVHNDENLTKIVYENVKSKWVPDMIQWLNEKNY